MTFLLVVLDKITSSHHRTFIYLYFFDLVGGVADYDSVYGSTSLVTTAPAPTTAPVPIVIPFRMIAPAPIQQSLPIFTPPDELEYIYEYVSRSHEKQE